MAASDNEDLIELAGLVRGFADQVRRSQRLAQRVPRPTPRGTALLFVGVDPLAGDERANELLDNMIAAMGWPRDQVGVCSSVDAAIIQSAQPRVMVVLGDEAVRRVLGADVALPAVRGTWQRWRDLDVMPTLHPSELLQAPERKRVAWQDLQAVMAKCAALGVVPRMAP